MKAWLYAHGACSRIFLYDYAFIILRELRDNDPIACNLLVAGLLNDSNLY